MRKKGEENKKGRKLPVPQLPEASQQRPEEADHRSRIWAPGGAIEASRHLDLEGILQMRNKDETHPAFHLQLKKRALHQRFLTSHLRPLYRLPAVRRRGRLAGKDLPQQIGHRSDRPTKRWGVFEVQKAEEQGWLRGVHLGLQDRAGERVPKTENKCGEVNN